jgi:menaquinone-dependent protoporphyrinogen oxidase
MTSTPHGPARVLIAYGSRNGGTAGIAEMVGSALRAEGVVADVQPAAQVRSVEEYDAVVLGGALYANHWHRAARRFTRRHAKALQGRPVWMFSSGPLDDSADTNQIGPVPQAAAAMTALHARQHVTFGGQLTDQAKGFIAKAMVRNGRGGDFRNPQRIEAWSRSIAADLR